MAHIILDILSGVSSQGHLVLQMKFEERTGQAMLFPLLRQNQCRNCEYTGESQNPTIKAALRVSPRRLHGNRARKINKQFYHPLCLKSLDRAPH